MGIHTFYPCLNLSQLNFLHLECSVFLKKKLKNVTWSRGMSRMSGILILSYRLKEVTNSYVFTLFLNLKNCSYPANQVSDWDGVWIKMYHFKWTSDLYWKIKIWILPTCDSFPLIMSRISRCIFFGKRVTIPFWSMYITWYLTYL